MKIIRLSRAFAPLLLLSPMAGAESPPSTPYEPAPVFENEELGGRTHRWVTRSTPAASEKPATETHRIPPPEPAAAPQRVAAEPAAVKGASSPQAVAGEAAAASDHEGAASSLPVGPIKTLLLENYPIGLIVLAMGGFVFWTSRGCDSKAGKRSRAPASAHSADFSRETGVARYLKSSGARGIAGSAETGVARYLKGRAAAPTPGAPETGVARYLQSRQQQRSPVPRRQESPGT